MSSNYGGGYDQYGGNPYGNTGAAGYEADNRNDGGYGASNPYGGQGAGYGSSNPYGGQVKHHPAHHGTDRAADTS